MTNLRDASQQHPISGQGHDRPDSEKGSREQGCGDGGLGAAVQIIQEKRLNKRQLQMLERVWLAEIDDRLPFQSKSKVLNFLFSEGYIQPMSTTLDSLYPVRVDGWQLTHLGRLTYCMSPDD